MYLSIGLSICLSINPTTCLLLCLSVYLSTYLSTHHTIYLSIISPSLCLSIYLSIYMSACLSLFVYHSTDLNIDVLACMLHVTHKDSRPKSIIYTTRPFNIALFNTQICPPPPHTHTHTLTHPNIFKKKRNKNQFIILEICSSFPFHCKCNN